MASYLDRCIFLAASGGTGSFVVAGAVSGFMTPATAGATDGQHLSYAAQVVNLSGVVTAWETGSGYYRAVDATFSRSQIFSSNANALVNFATAPQVMLSARAADLTTGFVSVKEFGAVGQDRLYTNIVGGSGYTGGSASNLSPNPEDATAWTLGNVTVTSNAILDPRGNLLADAIVETATANVRHSLFDGFGVMGAGSTIRYEVEVKPNLRTWFRMTIWDGGVGVFCTFNLTGAGTVGSALLFTPGFATFTSAPSIVALANGWYRCTLEGTVSPGSTIVQPIIDVLTGDLTYWDTVNDSTHIYTGNNTTPAIYLGLSKLYAVTKYKGSVFIAGDGIYSGVPLTGGTGTQARANITVALGQVLSVESYCPGSGYAVGDILSCSNADIGGTGSGFTCTVATLGNDTVAVQAALDSSNGSPLTVFFPPGTYNIFPQTNTGEHCLLVRRSNLRILGAGRSETKIQCFVSGGRHPETSYDIPPLGQLAGAAWRGCGFKTQQSLENVVWEKLRLTGLCKRHNDRWPLAGVDPAIITPSNPLGIYGDGDGWDTFSHHAISRMNDDITRGFRIIDCEIDSWKGEIIGGGGETDTPADVKTQWWFEIERTYFHDTHGDAVSVSGNCRLVDCEIAWSTNGMENGTLRAYNLIDRCYFHDNGKGVVLVVDSGAAPTGQSIVTNSIFQRCWVYGVFLFRGQTDTVVDSNVFVDCATGICVSLISGPQPDANIFVRRNLLYNNEFTNTVPIITGLSTGIAAALTNVQIEDNKAAVTPAGQAAGFSPTKPWDLDIQSATLVELVRNDMRVTRNRETFSGGTGSTISNENIYDKGARYREVHHILADMSKTNNTLTDIPGWTEVLSDSPAPWFEAFLFITAPAGGAQVAVVGTTAGAAFRYDVEMWAGNTIDAASGVGLTSGTPFASAAAITKIKITGIWELFPGTQPGFIKIQFAQNTTNTTPSKVLIGSWFKVRNAYPTIY